jgi:hypothetical protein
VQEVSIVDPLEQALEENIRYYRMQEEETLAALSGLPRGSIKVKRSKGRTYHYLQYRDGGRVVQRYMGTSYPAELAAQIERRRRLRAQLADIRRALRLLGRKKDEDLLGPVRDLVVILAGEGLWEDGAEIVGSWCFKIYQHHLGVRSYPVMTDDIDILVPMPWKGRALDVAERLRMMGFTEHFNPDGSTSYVRPGLRVDFLSPTRRMRGSRSTSMGVQPQELAFMDMLLESPRSIKLMAGVRVLVPSPASFAIHKLIIAGRRTVAAKRLKDLVQALSVVRALLSDDEGRDELVEAWRRTIPAWRRKALASARQARAELPLEEGIVDGLIDLLEAR